MATYTTFRCPNCGEFVNDSLDSCKYCSTPLDAESIRASVNKQERLNEAYRSASNTRILAGAMTTFFFLGFLPFVGLIATWVFRIIFLCIPVLLIYWVVKYWDLSKNEPEIKDARKYLLTALGIWLIYPALYILLVLLVLMGLTAYSLSR